MAFVLFLEEFLILYLGFYFIAYIYNNDSVANDYRFVTCGSWPLVSRPFLYSEVLFRLVSIIQTSFLSFIVLTWQRILHIIYLFVKQVVYDISIRLLQSTRSHILPRILYPWASDRCSDRQTSTWVCNSFHKPRLTENTTNHNQEGILKSIEVYGVKGIL